MVKNYRYLLASIGKPALILLDEPLATLDEEALHHMPDLITAYHKEFQTSFILSSHQPFKSYSADVYKILITEQTLQVIT
jgi:ABC-2 type transport system ATP-binding protein